MCAAVAGKAEAHESQHPAPLPMASHKRGDPEADPVRTAGPWLGAPAGLSPPSRFAGENCCSRPSQQDGVRPPGRLAGVLLGDVEAPFRRRLSYRSLRAAICLMARGLPTSGRRSEKTAAPSRPAHGSGHDEQQSASTGKRCFAAVWHALVIERERPARRTWRRLRTQEASFAHAGTMFNEALREFASSMRQGILVR